MLILQAIHEREGNRGKAVVAGEETLVNPDNYMNDRSLTPTKGGILRTVFSPIGQSGGSKLSDPLSFRGTLYPLVDEPLWLASSSSPMANHIIHPKIVVQSPHANSAL